MNRTHNQFRALIKKYSKKWKDKLYLGMWRLDTYIKDFIPSSEDTVSGYSVAAVCDTDWKYFIISISFSELMMRDKPEKEIEHIVMHELLHAVVNEMRVSGIDHEERVVSHLETIFGHIDGIN